MAVKEDKKPSVEINNLRFTYPGIDGHPSPGSTPLIDDFSLTLYPVTAVFLSDLMAQWRREVAFAAFEMPIQMDVSAEKMIFGVSGTDPKR